MPNDPFGQIQNQKPLDIAYLGHDGIWRVLSYPTSGTPAVLFAGGPAPPAATTISWQSRATLLTATDIPSHDNSRHDDRTRTCWIGAAGNWSIDVGTPDLASRGTAGSMVPAWAFDGAATESIVTTIFLPADWDNGAISPTIYWAPSNGAVGNVFWNVNGAGLASAQQIDQGAEFGVQDVFGTPGVAEQLVVSTVSNITPDSALVRINVQRIGANASDTYDAADAWFLGLLISYTADM